jgi:hypothetical protein
VTAASQLSRLSPNGGTGANQDTHLVRVEGVAPNRIVLWGTSIGSGATCHLAASLSRTAHHARGGGGGDHVGAPAAVVLQSPIKSCVRVVSTTLAYIPFTWVGAWRGRAAEAMAQRALQGHVPERRSNRLDHIAVSERRVARRVPRCHFSDDDGNDDRLFVFHGDADKVVPFEHGKLW